MTLFKQLDIFLLYIRSQSNNHFGTEKIPNNYRHKPNENSATCNEQLLLFHEERVLRIITKAGKCVASSQMLQSKNEEVSVRLMNILSSKARREKVILKRTHLQTRSGDIKVRFLKHFHTKAL